MDSFAEQLLKKKKGGKEYAIIVLILLALSLVTVAAFLFFPVLGMLAALIVVFAFYGAWWLIQTQHIEYEYSVLNGDLDIDRITGKRKRKRVVQVRAQKIDEFLPVTENTRTDGFNRVLYACVSPDTATYYVTYNSKKNGRTIVFLEPNAKVFAELYDGQNRIKQLALEKACREAGIDMPKAEA